MAERIILQSKLTVDDKILLLMEQGLSEEEAKLAVKNGIVAASEGVVDATTKKLTFTFKGLWATLMANPFIAIAAALAAGAIAIAKYDKKQQELRQETIATAKTASQEADSISKLYRTYDEATKAYANNEISKEELESATNNLIDGLGRERGEIESLIDVYGSLDGAIRNVTANSLREKRGEIIEGVKAAEEEVVHALNWSASNRVGFVGANNTFDKSLIEYLADEGFEVNNQFGDRSITFKGNGSTYEGIVQMYRDIEHARQALIDYAKDANISTESLMESTVWKSIDKKFDLIKDEVQESFDLIDSLNKDIALEGYLRSGLESPTNAEEYYQLRDALIEITQADADFIGSQEEAEKAVDSFMESLPDAKKFATNFNKIKHDMKSLSKETQNALNDISKLTNKQKEDLKEWADQFGYSIDDLVSYFKELYGISETSLEETNRRNIGSLTSFRDELQKTSAALEAYNNLMEGGEKGDSIAAMQEIYKGAMEDLKSGKIDSNRLRAAAQLFFSPEQLADMNYDMEEIGRRLQSSMFEGLFDPQGESKNTAGQRMIKYIKDNADAFKGVAQVSEDSSGKINFFYSSLKELADAFGVSEAAMGAFLDEWDAYGVNVMRSTEENRELIADYEDMVKEAGNAKDAVRQLAEQMHTEGSDIIEIGSIMKDLQNGGVIKLSDQELNDTLEGVFASFKEIDESDPEATAHLNGNPAINDANQLRRTLEAILTPPITTNVSIGTSYTLSGSGASNGRVTGTSTTGLNTKWRSRASGGTIGRDGEVLVNELAPELISDQGRAFIANGGKPGFVHLSKDAIVFNAEDTEQIFRYGFRDIEYPAQAEGTRNGLRDRLINGSRVGAAASLASKLKTVSIAKVKSYVQSQKSTTSTTPKPVGTAANYNSGNTNTSRLTNTTSTTVSYWTCPRCGTKTSTYMRKCDKCGYDRYSNSSSVPKTQQTQVQTQKSLGTIGRYTGSYIANQSGNFNELYSYEDAASAAGGGGGGGGGGGYESQSQTNPQKIDWIAVLLNRLERSIQDLEKIASSAFNKLDKRLGAAKQEVSKLNEEIDAQNRGYQRYIQEANSIGLRSDLAEKVKNGTIDINEYDDEELKQQIQEYQEWFFMMPPYTVMYTKNCF